MKLKVNAVTFDDYFTLRYPIEEKEDIIRPILRVLKRELDVDAEKFLKQYSVMDKLYRKRLKKTQHESLLDDIVTNALMACGYESKIVSGIVKEAVDHGLMIRRVKWFPDAKRTLLTLRKRGYKLGLISNTHWRILADLRKEFTRLFDVVTLSYEHGYAKPHPSIFVATLNMLKTNPDQCLHVGDDPIADIYGAENVGMKTAFIKRGETKADADIEINQLSELTTYLQKLRI